jgi:hypothetical protein
MKGKRLGLTLATALFLGACGGVASAVPTPTPIAVLAQQYLRAADNYNKATAAVDARLSQDCKALDPCKRDYADYAQIDNTFATEVRAIKFPASLQADFRALLDILRRVISFDEDAAQAVSLDQINADDRAIAALSNQQGDAADHLRLDLGLPPPPRLGPSPSSSAAPSATA